MIEYCFLCRKTHEASGWRTIDVGDSAIHWACEKYGKITYKEFVPQRVVEERKAYAKDTVQPWRAGEPSREFIETYPKRAAKMFTPKELRKARPTWKGEPGW